MLYETYEYIFIFTKLMLRDVYYNIQLLNLVGLNSVIREFFHVVLYALYSVFALNQLKINYIFKV